MARLLSGPSMVRRARAYHSRVTDGQRRWTTTEREATPVNARELVTQRIIDVVRARPSAVMSLADLGIGPRYLYWTLESASRDLGQP